MHEFISIGTIFATILHSERLYREVEIRGEMAIVSDTALDLSAFHATLELGNYLLLNPGYYVAIRTMLNTGIILTYIMCGTFVMF